MQAEKRSLLAHERVAQEVGEVAAEQGEHEPHGHLGLAQGDAAERHQKRDHGADEGARDEPQHQTPGGHGHDEASHGRQQDGAVDR